MEALPQFLLSLRKTHRKKKNRLQTIKHHDPPKTPYQRIMESPHIHESVKESLSKQLENPNPFLLRKIMDKKMKKIFSINTKPG